MAIIHSEITTISVCVGHVSCLSVTRFSIRNHLRIINYRLKRAIYHCSQINIGYIVILTTHILYATCARRYFPPRLILFSRRNHIHNNIISDFFLDCVSIKIYLVSVYIFICTCVHTYLGKRFRTTEACLPRV